MIQLAGQKLKFAEKVKQQLAEDVSYFEKFEDFPYDDWVPARQRYEFANKYAKGDSLLDIGCGFYPISAEIEMFRKVGLDVSVKAARKSKKDFNEFYLIDITNVGTKFLKENLGAFDTIVASEILEHLTDPADVVRKIESLLNPNGKVLITVPNGYSFAMEMDRYLNNGELKKYKAYHRTHVSLLSTKEWEGLFDEAGLEVEVFDFRPTFLFGEFPNETTPGWKEICALAPDMLAHQFFYVLKKKGAGR